MNGLPSVLTRPAAALDPPRRSVAAPDPTAVTMQNALDAGIPARTVLDGDLSLVLSVGAGQIRRYLDADPAEVLVAIGGTNPEPDPDTYRDPDAVAARFTLVSGAILGDSVPVVLGQPVVIGIGSQTVAEVTVSALTITNGSLRSPGQYGSAVTFLWHDLRPAPDSGPALPAGDPSIPVRVVWKRQPLLWFTPGILGTRYVLSTDMRWVS